SVMSGFSTKLRDRLHGLLSDVLIEATSLEGYTDPGGKMDKIRKDPFLADKIEAITPTMEIFAMIQFRLPNGETMTRTVRLIGVDPEGRSAIGGFQGVLMRQKNTPTPSFAVGPALPMRSETPNPFSAPHPPPH